MKGARAMLQKYQVSSFVLAGRFAYKRVNMQESRLADRSQANKFKGE